MHVHVNCIHNMLEGYTCRIKIQSLLLLPTDWPPAGGGGGGERTSPQGSLDGINPWGSLDGNEFAGVHPPIDTIHSIKLEFCRKLWSNSGLPHTMQHFNIVLYIGPGFK